MSDEFSNWRREAMAALRVSLGSCEMGLEGGGVRGCCGSREAVGRSVGRSRAVVAVVGCCCCGSGARCGWAGQPGAGFESPARARAPKPKPFGAAAAAAAALPPSESTLVQPTTSSNGSVIDTSHTPPPRPHDGLLPV